MGRNRGSDGKGSAPAPEPVLQSKVKTVRESPNEKRRNIPYIQKGNGKVDWQMVSWLIGGLYAFINSYLLLYVGTEFSKRWDGKMDVWVEEVYNVKEAHKAEIRDEKEKARDEEIEDIENSVEDIECAVFENCGRARRK